MSNPLTRLVTQRKSLPNSHTLSLLAPFMCRVANKRICTLNVVTHTDLNTIRIASENFRYTSWLEPTFISSNAPYTHSIALSLYSTASYTHSIALSLYSTAPHTHCIALSLYSTAPYTHSIALSLYSTAPYTKIIYGVIGRVN